MEPEALEKGFYTDMDAEIRNTDVPERFQLRSIPVRYEFLMCIEQNLRSGELFLFLAGRKK